ncbi:MAG: hypothetical protein LBL47_02190 [Lactobacillus sp.]|nr:hypothetical protein [Lactobacillus sp.]
MDLEKEVKKIIERNKKVEADKAWETSFSRKILVALATYFVMILVMHALDLDKPYIGAIIPTLGFVLSTLSVNFARSIWIKFYKK